MNRRRKQEVSLRGDDEILIAAHPAKTLAGEIELIKAGLLYGQTVRLISPGAMYLAAADSVRSTNVYELCLLFDDFGLVDIDAATRLKIQS